MGLNEVRESKLGRPKRHTTKSLTQISNNIEIPYQAPCCVPPSTHPCKLLLQSTPLVVVIRTIYAVQAHTKSSTTPFNKTLTKTWPIEMSILSKALISQTSKTPCSVNYIQHGTINERTTPKNPNNKRV